MNDVLHSNIESPVEPDDAPKVASKSIFTAVLCGGIQGEVLERKLADEDYFSTHAERREKVQHSYNFIDPATFRESLIYFRVQRERAMNSMEEVVNLCTALQRVEEHSAAALAQALVANQSAAMADSAKQCKDFVDDATNAASSACEAAEEAASLTIMISKEMRDAEHAAQMANLMARLQPIRILASSSAESARRASDTARDATSVAAVAMEQFEIFKATEYQEIWTIASDLSIHICACAASLHNARQSVLHSEWALQGAEDGMTLSAASSARVTSSQHGASALTLEGSNETISVMDSMAQIRACIHNLHNVRDFLARRGASQCAEECDRMLIGAIASEKRASALAVATDVAIAPYRTVESIAASLLDDLVAESYREGEELMLEKANKLWAIMLQKRLRKKRNDAHQRIVDGISDLSRSTILEAMDRAVFKVEHSRCQSVVDTAQNVLDYGENLHSESQECCNAFLECSLEAAKRCEASHDRMTSCVTELRAQMNKCISSADILDPLKAAKEMQTMWNIFSEMESNTVSVKQCFEEKAVRERLTRAGILPAIDRSKKKLLVEPPQEAVLKGAVMTGDEQGVKAMIVQGCDVNACTTGGYTLLHEAAERGFAKITKLLIYGGADVTRRTAKGSTPLLTAASFGHTETVGVILQAGADPNATNHQGSRALLTACMNGHGEVAGKLVLAGADRCVADNKSNNAFHLAAVSGCAAAISHMLGLELEATKGTVQEEILLAVRTLRQPLCLSFR